MSIVSTTGTTPLSIVLIRLIVGAVFLSEGIQKFLFPEALGVGRFLKIGIPSPEITAPFVGVVEIICGVCILIILGAGKWSIDWVLSQRTPDRSE